MTQVWCGIPVYNNAATIADVARRCRDKIAKVIVVDDGSTDADLRDVLKSLDVAVVRHPENLGKGAALLTAFAYAAEHGAEYLVTLDGDGQHLPEDIVHFLGRLSPDTILLGSRDEVVGPMPRSSQFGREFSDFWICVETGAAVCDTQSGFRAYPVRNVMQLQLGCRHYNLEMEIVTRAIWAGMKVDSVPIRVWYPEASQSASSFHPVRDNWRISLLHTRLVLRCLAPIPHRRIADLPRPPRRTVGQWLRQLCAENSSPLGLAAAVVATIPTGIVLWPWGAIVVLYLAMRLHLNKLMVLANLVICMPPAMAALCLWVGRVVLQPGASARMVWVVGAHVVALPLAAVLASAVYAVARYCQPRPVIVAGDQK